MHALHQSQQSFSSCTGDHVVRANRTTYTAKKPTTTLQHWRNMLETEKEKQRFDAQLEFHGETRFLRMLERSMESINKYGKVVDE